MEVLECGNRHIDLSFSHLFCFLHSLPYAIALSLHFICILIRFRSGLKQLMLPFFFLTFFSSQFFLILFSRLFLLVHPIPVRLLF